MFLNPKLCIHLFIYLFIFYFLFFFANSYILCRVRYIAKHLISFPLVTMQKFALHLTLIHLLSNSNLHAEIRLLPKQKNSGHEQFTEITDPSMS